MLLHAMGLSLHNGPDPHVAGVATHVGSIPEGLHGDDIFTQTRIVFLMHFWDIRTEEWEDNYTNSSLGYINNV